MLKERGIKREAKKEVGSGKKRGGANKKISGDHAWGKPEECVRFCSRYQKESENPRKPHAGKRHL